MKVNCHRGGRVRNGPMIFAIGHANPRAPPIGSSVHGGTEGSNSASSSRELIANLNSLDQGGEIASLPNSLPLD